MWTYNKGEWSEIYTFAYLLSNPILYSADKDLNVIEAVYFPVLKIVREETAGNIIDYKVGNRIKIYRGDTLLREVSKREFDRIVLLMQERIPEGVRAFEIPEAEDFFRSIYCEKVKANPNRKEDITLQLQDINTGIRPTCGFSIKSYLGARPTLFNPGMNTRFTYLINDCDDETMEIVNSINGRGKIIRRLNYLRDHNELIPIEHSISEVFEDNLQFVDSQMPLLLQYLLLYANYLEIASPSVSDTVDLLKRDNPLNYRNTELYTYKIKKLLAAFALGMTAENAEWLGQEAANGGYITVKADGSVVCYHLYNRQEFEDYLFSHTVIEHPSETRYDYAHIYKNDDDYEIKLCLQIRFMDQN